MSILNRIRNLFKKTMSATGYFFAFASGKSNAYRYEIYAQEGHRMNPVVFACVDQITGAAKKIKLILIQKGEIIENPGSKELPIQELLKHPNPNESMEDFVERWFMHMCLAGMAFVRAIGVGKGTGIDGFDRSKQGELWLLQPNKVTIETKDKIVTGYTYANQTFTPDEIMHFQYPDALEDFQGMPPLRSAARVVDIHNKMYAWNDKMFENHGVPAAMIGVKGLSHLDEDSLTKLFDDWHKRYGGIDNVGKVGFMAGDGFDFTQLSYSPKDLEWLSGEGLLSRRICGVFKVPSQLLGDPDTSKYSNYKEARRALYDEKVLPDMRKFIAGLNRWLMIKFDGDYELDLDYSHIKVLQDDETDEVNRLEKSTWMTVNEKREERGLIAIDGGDVVMVPFNMVPLTMAVEPREPKQTKMEDFSGSLYPNEGARTKAVARNNARRNLWEKRYESELSKHWKDQLARVLKKLRSGKAAAVPDVFNLMDEAAEYGKDMRRVNEGLMLDFGQGALAEVGSDLIFDVDRPSIQKWLTGTLAKNGKGIGTTTAGRIKTVLTEGVVAGEGVDKLAKRITDLYGKFTDNRAKVIARTEVGIASGEAKLQGYKDSNVARKEWLSAFVPDSRPEHIAADGQVVAIGDDFDIGGLSSNTAPCQTGDPSHDVNCLCTFAPMGEE